MMNENNKRRPITNHVVFCLVRFRSSLRSIHNIPNDISLAFSPHNIFPTLRWLLGIYCGKGVGDIGMLFVFCLVITRGPLSLSSHSPCCLMPRWPLYILPKTLSTQETIHRSSLWTLRYINNPKRRPTDGFLECLWGPDMMSFVLCCRLVLVPSAFGIN